MRRIIFRGKKTDNGQWVYGNYNRVCGDGSVTRVEWKDGNREFIEKPIYLNEHYILEQKSLSFSSGWSISEAYREHSVMPESVGQFTGLLDKNGKEIYEGDILKCDSYCVAIEFRGGQFVGFNENNLIEETQNRNWLQWEIVGTIHQNPELLK